MRTRSSLFDDRRLFDVIKLGELGVQVSVSAAVDLPLIGAFSVLSINLIYVVHSFDHFTKRREPLAIKKAIIDEIDEHLGRS